MSDSPRAERTAWRGLACTHLCLPNGDSAVVSDFGAQVLSWEAQGLERLFLSPRAVLGGSAPIRGGIPVCFPQFNQRGPLPKHGVVRRTIWEWQGAEVDGHTITACWRWNAAQPLHPDFPHGLRAALRVQLAPAGLQVQLQATNTGDTPLAFTGALHSYLAVHDAVAAQLHGLEGQAFWDAAHGFAPTVQTGSVALGEEVDRVYARAVAPLRLQDAQGALDIAQDAAWPETVVWNPGPVLCAQLGDMAPDSWRQMLCVEAALINQPQALQPGESWQASQYLRVP
ncbi:MAG: D-hexose-6-phosphate mutarotase [Comamonas sp.]